MWRLRAAHSASRTRRGDATDFLQSAASQKVMRMAERSVCPHCSFRNFSVSQHCARCEKPLNPAASAVASRSTQRSPAGRPPAVPAVHPRARHEALSQRTTAARPISNSDETSRGPRGAPGPRARFTPPPLPPSGPTSHGGYDDAVHEERTRLGVPLPPPLPAYARGAPPAPPTADLSAGPAAARPSAKPLQPAPLWRHAMATAIDAFLPFAAMVAWAALEMLLRRGHWPDTSSDALTGIAVWLHAYAGTAQRMLLLGAAVAASHTVFGLRTGRTAGRHACNLLLVGLSGSAPTKGASWSAALWHVVGGIVSLFALGAGHFWPIVDPRHRTWANVLSRTLVVCDAPRRSNA